LRYFGEGYAVDLDARTLAFAAGLASLPLDALDRHARHLGFGGGGLWRGGGQADGVGGRAGAPCQQGQRGAGGQCAGTARRASQGIRDRHQGTWAVHSGVENFSRAWRRACSSVASASWTGASGARLWKVCSMRSMMVLRARPVWLRSGSTRFLALVVPLSDSFSR